MNNGRMQENSDHTKNTYPKQPKQKGQASRVEETLMSVVNESNGIIQSKDLTSRGIHPEQLQRYLKQVGRIQKIAHGIYASVDDFTDEFQLLQIRFKKGIYSYETALFLHDLTDVTPFDYHMTFPQGYNNKNLTESGIIPSYAVPDRYELGVSTIDSPSGNIIRVYDVEKTLCDMFSSRHKADKDIQLTALKRYMKRKNKDISKLMRYAKILRVEKGLRPYLEVLI